jgi:hypothetical protein
LAEKWTFGTQNACRFPFDRSCTWAFSLRPILMGSVGIRIRHERESGGLQHGTCCQTCAVRGAFCRPDACRKNRPSRRGQPRDGLRLTSRHRAEESRLPSIWRLAQRGRFDKARQQPFHHRLRLSVHVCLNRSQMGMRPLRVAAGELQRVVVPSDLRKGGASEARRRAVDPIGDGDVTP